MPASTPANALNITASGIVKFDGTATFSADTVTQYDVLVGGASNAITSVGPGTAGQALLSQGSSSDAAYVTPTAGTNLSVTTNASTLQYAASGGLVLITTLTASNSASLTVTSGISATYNNYLIVANNVSNSSGASLLYCQLSSNGGSSYISSGYTSGAQISTPGNATFSNSNATAGLILASTTSSEYSSFSVYLCNMTNSLYPVSFGSQVLNVTSATLPNYYWNGGSYNTTITVNALQIIMASNNIQTGTFKLYGILE